MYSLVLVLCLAAAPAQECREVEVVSGLADAKACDPYAEQFLYNYNSEPGAKWAIAAAICRLSGGAPQ